MKPARRRFLRELPAAFVLLPAGRAGAQQAASPVVEVYLSPSCGCCKDWIAHLEAHGFRTVVHEVGNTTMRARLGVAERYGSCHTARVGGYVVEGHVPAPDILRLLRERPAALGLAVPRMPVGSPGMDGPEYGGRRDPYDVLLLDRSGGATVWAAYR